MYWSSRKIFIILIKFERNLNFLVRFSGNTEVSNFMKFLPVRAEFFDEDGERRTDMTKSIFAFRNYENML